MYKQNFYERKTSYDRKKELQENLTNLERVLLRCESEAQNYQIQIIPTIQKKITTLTMKELENRIRYYSRRVRLIERWILEKLTEQSLPWISLEEYTGKDITQMYKYFLYGYNLHLKYLPNLAQIEKPTSYQDFLNYPDLVEKAILNYFNKFFQDYKINASFLKGKEFYHIEDFYLKKKEEIEGKLCGFNPNLKKDDEFLTEEEVEFMCLKK